MAISAITIYNDITLASTATTQVPYSGVTAPVQVTTLVGNATAFNFIVTSGSTPPGSNASITFKYAFSMEDYSSSPGLVAALLPIISNSGGAFNLRASNNPSGVKDITTPWTVPILGNFLYCWLELRDFTAPITSGFFAQAIPSSVATISQQRN